jgi:hypothetical protein
VALDLYKPARAWGPGRTSWPDEHHHVRPGPRREPAALGEAEQVGLGPGEPVHGPFERHELAVAYPGAKEVGGLDGVTDLPHVGSRVGQADHRMLVAQQCGDLVHVVVGDGAGEAEGEVGLVKGEI